MKLTTTDVTCDSGSWKVDKPSDGMIREVRMNISDCSPNLEKFWTLMLAAFAGGETENMITTVSIFLIKIGRIWIKECSISSIKHGDKGSWSFVAEDQCIEFRARKLETRNFNLREYLNQIVRGVVSYKSISNHCRPSLDLTSTIENDQSWLIGLRSWRLNGTRHVWSILKWHSKKKKGDIDCLFWASDLIFDGWICLNTVSLASKSGDWVSSA